MNDDIERINEEYRADHDSVSPGDQSGAKFSNITSPEQDEKKRKMAEGIIGDLANQRLEIDSIKQALGGFEKVMNDQTAAINTLSQMIQQPQGTPVVSTADGQPPVQGLNMDSLAALGDLAEKAIGAYKSLKGEPSGPAPLIDQAFINDRMRQSFLNDLDTGSSISNFIKDSLKKKVTKEVINSTFQNMGNANDTTHKPE